MNENDAGLSIFGLPLVLVTQAFMSNMAKKCPFHNASLLIRCYLQHIHLSNRMIIKMTISLLRFPSREERHRPPTGASRPVRPAAHLRRHAAHPQPGGAARHRGDRGGRGQAGPLVRDRWGEESGGQPDSAGIRLQPPPRSAVVEEQGRDQVHENRFQDISGCILPHGSECCRLGLFEGFSGIPFCHPVPFCSGCTRNCSIRTAPSSAVTPSQCLM